MARGKIPAQRVPSRGRPTKLTQDVERAICANLALSIPDKYAAEEAGIDDITFQLWIRRGREGRPPYAAFYKAVTRARASAVKSLTIRALGGGKGSSASMWTLERRYRNDYGPSQKVELSENPDSPMGGIRAALEGMTMAQLNVLAAGGKSKRK